MRKHALGFMSALCLFAGLAEANGQSVGTSAVQLNTATFTSLGSAPELIQAAGGSIVVIIADTQPSPTAVGNALTTSMAPQIFSQADSSSVIWARGTTGQAQAIVTPILYGSVPIGAATQAAQTNVQSALGTSATTAITVQGSPSAVAQPVNIASGNASAGIYSSASVGTSDGIILSASTASRFLDIRNDSPTATICLNFGSAAVIYGTTCAAGNITLPPLWRQSWGTSDTIPTDAIHAIASAASTPASIGVK